MKSKKPEVNNAQSNTTKSYISALSEFLLKLGNIEPCSITLHGAKIGDIERYSCKIEVGGKRPKE